MPAEKPLTADDVKPGVRVRGPGGNVFRIVRVELDGTVAMAIDDAAPEYERDAAQMLRSYQNGAPRYTVVDPPPDPRDARIADLEREKAALESKVNAERAQTAIWAQTARGFQVERDAIAAGLREACGVMETLASIPVIAYRVDGRMQSTIRHCHDHAESFHPSAQPPGTTGESGPGIVSTVATESSVATVKEPAP